MLTRPSYTNLVLELLEELPNDQLIHPSRLKDLIKADLTKESIREIGSFSKDRVEAIVQSNIRSLSALTSEAENFFPEKSVRREALFSWADLAQYGAEQIRLIDCASNALDAGIIDLNDATGLTMEQAQTANALGSFSLYRSYGQTLEKATQGAITTSDIYSMPFDHANLLSKIAICCYEEGSGMNYEKLKKVKSALPQIFDAMENGDIRYAVNHDNTRQHPGYQKQRVTEVDQESLQKFIEPYLTVGPSHPSTAASLPTEPRNDA